MLACSLLAAACETVSVEVPPEVDMRGIRTVAIQAKDLLIDPAPVAVLLRVETAERIRRHLPALTLVERFEQADALLDLEVANHGMGPVQFRPVINVSTGQTTCEAWQDAYLAVAASIVVRPESVLLWQSVLDAQERIELDCVLPRGVRYSVRSPAQVDRQLVRAVVDELARKLAGYTRTELRSKPAAPATP